eukprot:gene14377-17467_t
MAGVIMVELSSFTSKIWNNVSTDEKLVKCMQNGLFDIVKCGESAMPSLKSHRRKQIMSSRKGNRHGSLWLVYSPKSNEDLTITSDRELLYWISELEINHNVRRFKFDAEVEVCLDESDPDKFESVSFTLVECVDGTTELHVIDARENLDTDLKSLSVRFRSENHVTHKAKIVRVPLARLKLFSPQLGFWLRILAFASQVREYKLDVEADLVNLAVSTDGEGTISTLLSTIQIQDPALAVGAICRLILSGGILVEAGGNSFGHNTSWRSS